MAKVTESIKADIRERYQAGELCESIAATYGISSPAVRYHCKDIQRDRPRRTVIPANRKDEIIERYKSGESVVSLASHFGASATTIRRRLHGVLNTKPRLTSEQVAEMRRLYVEGYASRPMLADRYGVKATTIAFRLCGLRPKNPGGFTDDQCSQIVSEHVGCKTVNELAHFWRASRRLITTIIERGGAA